MGHACKKMYLALPSVIIGRLEEMESRMIRKYLVRFGKGFVLRNV